MKLALLGLAVAAALYGLHRTALWAERRGWIYYRHRRGSSGALGTAFLEVQKIYQPQIQYVIEEKVKDEKDEQDEGDPPVPGGARPRR